MPSCQEKKCEVRIILHSKSSRRLLLSCPVYLGDLSTFLHQIMLLYIASCGLCVVLERKIFFVEKPTDMHHGLWPPLLTPVLVYVLISWKQRVGNTET